jgi:hypothetical protein
MMHGRRNFEDLEPRYKQIQSPIFLMKLNPSIQMCNHYGKLTVAPPRSGCWVGPGPSVADLESWSSVVGLEVALSVPTWEADFLSTKKIVIKKREGEKLE